MDSTQKQQNKSRENVKKDIQELLAKEQLKAQYTETIEVATVVDEKTTKNEE